MLPKDISVLAQDLREICDITGRSSLFTRFVDERRQRHRAKVSLLKKLDGAMGLGAASTT